jgi:hypothetical protein
MKFFRKVKIPEAYSRVEWCRATLGKDVTGGNWWRHRGHLYFNCEKCYNWYQLAWS